MTNRNTILNELKEVNSTLGNLSPQNLYAVPYGYFEGLPTRIMARIKALEATSTKEELEYSAPLLNNVSKESLYSVPADYFQNFADDVMQRINGKDVHQSSEEEIQTLSPLLSSLKNRNPYSVPAGYFEALKTAVEKKETKVISIASRRWYRVAVAAVVIGIVAVTGLLLLNDQPNVMKDPEAWIKKNVNKKVSQDKIDELATLTKTNENSTVTDETKTATEQAEIKEMLKDVPEKDIEDFLNDAVALSSNDDANSLMN